MIQSAANVLFGNALVREVSRMKCSWRYGNSPIGDRVFDLRCQFARKNEIKMSRFQARRKKREATFLFHMN